ncbi:hypothetical protein SAMN05444340_103289 [Citreimonas salinaria]|uniref:Uncharacterized protein n=2 Tax=Citreimonas salinaria TaxID=321339 RepID=A0A1H3HA34_9RHOB|nr:hypothetical protein SAMN05444340_103289 [Citreimonas salinaria]
MRKVMHPRYAALLSGAYYASGLHRYAGFYTYRYCNLYCRDERTLHSGRLRDLASLRAFEEANCYIDDFIQTARLTADFVALIERHGWADEETARAAIGEKDRVNTSRKGLTKAEHFYDAETADLVAERERLLIDRFGYRRPDV